MDRFIVYIGSAYSVEWEGCAWLTKDGEITTRKDNRAMFGTAEDALSFLTGYERATR